MSSVFEAVSEQTRRRILQALRDAGDELSVSELVEQLEVSQPTVSKHLKVLREHDLVEVREDGQRRLYRLSPEALEPVREWVGEFFPQSQPSVELGIAADAASSEVFDSATGDEHFKADDPLTVRLGSSEHTVLRGVSQTIGQVAAGVARPFISVGRRIGQIVSRD